MIDDSLQALLDGRREVATPFVVPLDGGLCECVEVLRLLPGKRMVAKARYQSRDVVIKLFFGPGARRRFMREKTGIAHLLASNVPTPELIDTALLEFRKGWALVFEYVADARPLLPDDGAAAERVAHALGVLHAEGVAHRDLHLDNFLITDRDVYVIDGDSVTRTRDGLSEAQGLKYLALFLAQYSPFEIDNVGRLLACYEDARSWSASATRLIQLKSSVAAARQRRVGRYLAKTQRPCTEFVYIRRWRSTVLAVREVINDDLRAFAADPEAHLVSAEVVKAGNSATVFRTTIGNDTVIVKRYNIKNLWHRIRRWFKPRARIAWRNGHRLRFLCIPTADPLLLLECRWGPFRGLAYLVMVDRGDEDLASLVATSGWQSGWLDGVVRLFTDLRTAGLQHADTKATNFLVGDELVYLIDLDGMKGLAGSPHAHAEACVQDVVRFLDNWRGEDALPVQERLRASGLL